MRNQASNAVRNGKNNGGNGDVRHVNRTGALLSPALTAQLMEGARHTEPSAKGDGEELARVRVSYATQAEPVGSIPPPPTIKGVLKSAAKALTGKQALVFADKLGERLAFERSGTRLYDSLLSKFDAYGSWEGGPSRKDLQRIRADEHAHFTLVKQAIEQLGADPTAVTPSANLHAVASMGLGSVLADPRTDLRDGLEVVLIAELVDNDGWENLIDLARTMGHQDLADAFEQALGDEQQHLRRVRRWLANAISEAAIGKVSEPFVERALAREERTVARMRDQETRRPARTPRKGRPGRAASGRGAARKRTASRKRSSSRERSG
jgi:rubrerythrin